MAAWRTFLANDLGGRACAPFKRIESLRTWILALLVLCLGADTLHRVATLHAPGCPSYRPVSGVTLIAHAAGGLPDRMYANSIEALNLSYSHGLRTFEMDFHELQFGIVRAGHDSLDLLDPRDAWLSEVLDWMRHHPSTRLLIDMKTNNVSGLRQVAASAPDLMMRITPFVYRNTEYWNVRRLGFSLPIYALFHHEDSDWLAFANSHAFAAIALPQQKIWQIPQVRHPVIIYTLDDLTNAPGAQAVITNCMIPGSA